MCSSFSRQQLEEWLKTIEVKGGKVLDIGGSQNPLSSKRLKTFEPEEYKILDLEVPHECKKKPDIIGDLNKTGWEGDVTFNYFDVAFCLEVSEYWWNPFQALKSINGFLKKDGLLYLSTHFIYMLHPPKGADFLRYTPDGIKKILKEAGFIILEHRHRLAQNEYLTKYYAYDKMRGIKDNTNHNVIGSLIKCKKV